METSMSLESAIAVLRIVCLGVIVVCSGIAIGAMNDDSQSEKFPDDLRPLYNSLKQQQAILGMAMMAVALFVGIFMATV